jgi:hypothetical protein
VSQWPVDASAHLTNLRLHQLWPVLGQQIALRPLAAVGRVSGPPGPTSSGRQYPRSGDWHL